MYIDRRVVEQTFESRTEFLRRTGTPLFVGEFGPVYRNEQAVDAQRVQLLADQLDIYRQNNTGWAIWTYKTSDCRVLSA
jgi:aryl-phospho-beta-D-glucosidase BglC (GH1 family)